MNNIQNVKTLLCVLMFSVSNVFAQDQDEPYETVEKLTTIICDDYQRSGNAEGFELNGKASAEVVLLTKKLASVGFEGAGEIFSNEYVGLRQEDLAKEKISVRSCKLSVWSDFLALESKEVVHAEGVRELESDVYVLGLGRPLKILDGQAKIELVRLGTQGPFKIAYLSVEAPNRPKQTIATSPKSRNFPNLQEFEYRNVVYTVDITEIVLEDQEVTLNVFESE